MWTLLPSAYDSTTPCALRWETHHWKYENGVCSPALRKKVSLCDTSPCPSYNYRHLLSLVLALHVSYTTNKTCMHLLCSPSPHTTGSWIVIKTLSKWGRNSNKYKASYHITLVSSLHVYASKVWHCSLHTVAMFFSGYSCFGECCFRHSIAIILGEKNIQYKLEQYRFSSVTLMFSYPVRFKLST